MNKIKVTIKKPIIKKGSGHAQFATDKFCRDSSVSRMIEEIRESRAVIGREFYDDAEENPVHEDFSV